MASESFNVCFFFFCFFFSLLLLVDTNIPVEYLLRQCKSHQISELNCHRADDQERSFPFFGLQRISEAMMKRLAPSIVQKSIKCHFPLRIKNCLTRI